MKILFDHQIFSRQRYGGVSKYFCELLKKLPKNEWDTTVLFSNNEYYKSLDIAHFRFLEAKKIKGVYNALDLLNRPYTIYRFKRRDFDLIHLTHFDNYSFNYIRNIPVVVTFHDMNFSLYDKNEKMAHLQKLTVERADKVICVSQNTKNDLINMWGVAEEKLNVVYHGVDTPFDDDIIGDRLFKFPYILYVGQRQTFKNFTKLVRAFKIVSNKYNDIKLVCTNQPFNNDEIKMFNDLDISNKLLCISASELELANLYKYAEMFVYPSIYEGFGMPILEAMSYKCPTIISNTSCFPEIAGDASFYFDPNDINSITDSILHLLENYELRRRLVEKGIANCNKFTWERTANEHHAIYNDLI